MMFGMSDHDLLVAVVWFGIAFFFADAMWKIFCAQRRLDKIEKHLGLDR